MGNDNKSKFSEENLRQIDPIGEIQRYARQLWQEAGRPPDKSWQDFWGTAEAALLSGKSNPTASQRVRATRPAEQPSPMMQALIDQEDRPLLSVLAAALREELTEHETSCLGLVLSSHRIFLKDGSKFDPISNTDELANLLVEVAGEYDSSFIQAEGGGQWTTIPRSKRVAYWATRLAKAVVEDRALNNAERNTIGRLVQAIASEPRVKEVSYTG